LSCRNDGVFPDLAIRVNKNRKIFTGEELIELEDEEENSNLKKAEIVFGKSGLKQFNIFKIKHYFNGYFLVLQTSLIKRGRKYGNG